MDGREAIKLLNELLLRSDFTDQYGDMEDSSPYEETVEIAKEAIEKQIPQKINREYVSKNGISLGYSARQCPNCKADFYYADLGQTMFCDFCPDCGQALDWSVKDE